MNGDQYTIRFNYVTFIENPPDRGLPTRIQLFSGDPNAVMEKIGSNFFGSRSATLGSDPDPVNINPNLRLWFRQSKE